MSLISQSSLQLGSDGIMGLVPIPLFDSTRSIDRGCRNQIAPQESGNAELLGTTLSIQSRSLAIKSAPERHRKPGKDTQHGCACHFASSIRGCGWQRLQI